MHLPNLQQQATETFARMPLMLDAISLMSKILKRIDAQQDITSMCVKAAVKDRIPFIKIITELKEQAADRRSLKTMIAIFGKDIVQDILMFKTEKK